jgi:hypothetical protein
VLGTLNAAEFIAAARWGYFRLARHNPEKYG